MVGFYYVGIEVGFNLDLLNYKYSLIAALLKTYFILDIMIKFNSSFYSNVKIFFLS